MRTSAYGQGTFWSLLFSRHNLGISSRFCLFGARSSENKALTKSYTKYIQFLGRCLMSFCAFDNLVAKLAVFFLCQKMAVQFRYLVKILSVWGVEQ